MRCQISSVKALSTMITTLRGVWCTPTYEQTKRPRRPQYCTLRILIIRGSLLALREMKSNEQQFFSQSKQE